MTRKSTFVKALIHCKQPLGALKGSETYAVEIQPNNLATKLKLGRFKYR